MVSVRFLLFYSELALIDRNVTCSRLYLEGKNEEAMLSLQRKTSKM